MYERFTVLTDHATLHLLVTINDPSSRLIRWLLRLAEFDFQGKYTKGKINTQSDALSRLNLAYETIPHDNKDKIPVFELDVLNIGVELNKNPDEVEFDDVQYA